MTARLVVLLAVLAATAGGLSRVRAETGISSFLPAGDASLADYTRLAEEFGSDPVVVLLHTGTDTDVTDAAWLEAQLRLEGRLAALDDVVTVYGPGTMLNQVAGRAQDLLAELAGRRDAEIARAQEAARARHADPAAVAAAGRRARDLFDGRYGPVVVSGLPGGAPTLRNPTFVRKVLFDGSGQPRPQWRFVVPSAQTVAVLVRPREGLSAQATSALVGRVRSTVRDAAPPGTVTVSGAPVLVSAMADQALGDVPRLALLALAAVGLMLLGATWVRPSRRLAPLAVTLVALTGTVAVLGWLDRPLSLAVVAFCSVLLGLGCYYPGYVLVGAERRMVLVVASATAASLATMALSPVPLVRDLGTALAIGVLLATAVALVCRRWLVAGAGPTRASAATPAVAARAVLGRRTSAGLLLVATAAATVAAGAGWWALPGLPVRSDVSSFAGGLPAYHDAQEVADEIGASGELDLVLRGPDVTTPEALAWMRGAQDLLVTRYGDRLRPVISPPELLRFLGDDATQGQVEAALRILPEYLTQAVLTPDRGAAVLSYGVRLEDLDAVRALRDAVARDLPLPPAGYTSELAGLPVVGLRAEDLIAGDNLRANLLGVGAAALVLLLGLRHRRDADLALAAGLLATGLGFLALHLTGTALNPVTASLGALTAAVGCEFTVVQAEARRTGRRELRSAVLLGAATSAAGYLALLASSLGVVRGLGLLLAGSVALALGCSWLVVAVAQGRRGRHPDETPLTSSVPSLSEEPAHVPVTVDV